MRKLERIEIPATIVDIVLSRMNLLNDNEKNLLACGAVIGSKIDIDLINKLSEVSYERILSIVDRAVDLQLVEKSVHEKNTLQFIHDRIRDTFYQMLGEEEKKDLHLKIANELEKDKTSESKIFSLAHHYTCAGDSEKSLKYIIPAGNIAKGKYANAEAVKYYELAFKLLEDADQKENRQWIEISENLGELYLIIGNYDEAIDIFNKLQPLMTARMKKAKIYARIHKAYFKKGNWKECEEYARKCLLYLDEKLPVQKTGVILSIIKELAIHITHNLLPGLFMRKKQTLE